MVLSFAGVVALGASEPEIWPVTVSVVCGDCRTPFRVSATIAAAQGLWSFLAGLADRISSGVIAERL